MVRVHPLLDLLLTEVRRAIVCNNDLIGTSTLANNGGQRGEELFIIWTISENAKRDIIVLLVTWIGIDRLDDVSDLIFPHPIEHRQAQHLVRVLLRQGTAAAFMSKVCVALCEMRRNWIVNDGLNAMF